MKKIWIVPVAAALALDGLERERALCSVLERHPDSRE